jgi:hypothetical protein
MEKHNSVSEPMVKISGYVDALECQIPNKLAIDRVLQSLLLATKDLH